MFAKKVGGDQVVVVSRKHDGAVYQQAIVSRVGVGVHIGLERSGGSICPQILCKGIFSDILHNTIVLHWNVGDIVF